MLNLLALSAKSSFHPLSNLRVVSLYPLQARSIFGLFKKKDQEVTDQTKKDQKELKEPAKYHKPSLEAKDKEDIKQKIRSLDRSADDNLYGKYKKIRQTKKERDHNLE